MKNVIKKNYALFIAILVLIIAIVVLISASYALWVATYYQSSFNEINTSCFEVEFTELSSSINLTNTYPIKDEKGLKTTPYTFKIKNICDTKAGYTITLNTLKTTENKIPDDLIKYVFYKSTDAVTIGNYLSSASVNTDLDNIYTDLPIETSYIMSTGTLSKDEEAQFMLKLWIAEEATTAINGYSFTSSINVTSYATN
jgi:hypothetical protein